MIGCCNSAVIAGSRRPDRAAPSAGLVCGGAVSATCRAASRPMPSGCDERRLGRGAGGPPVRGRGRRGAPASVRLAAGASLGLACPFRNENIPTALSPSAAPARGRGPRTSASMSSGVLYIANDARAVAGMPIAIHDRLRAVVARADRHALAIDDRADVVRVDAVHDERQRRSPCARAVPIDAHARQRFDALPSPSASSARLVRANRVEPDRPHVLDRGAEADGARDVRRAGLELVRQVVPRAALEASPCESCRRRRGTAASPSSTASRPYSTPMPVGP